MTLRQVVMAVGATAILCQAGCSKAPVNEASQAKQAGISPAPSTAQADPPSDGPFGIAMGEPISKFKATNNGKPGYYAFENVPKPYPGIEKYIVEATPSTGVCFIKAIGVDINSSDFGSEIRSAVDQVKDDLSARYGEPEKVDLLMPGSIWNEGKDWLTGVSKKDRTYAYLWKRPANADPKVWRGVKTAGVMANGLYQKGYVTIEYDLDNEADCDAALKREAAKAL